jgi:DNA-directed RNA polymerase specialized sigma24 family protein
MTLHAKLLFELEGRGGAEIAQMAGVPVNTVWLLRLFRARKAPQQRGERAAKSGAHIRSLRANPQELRGEQ